jgi:asparagine synthase (glutamine-hydrolysing)
MMCGIGGHIGEGYSFESLETKFNQLIHRGPDQQTFFSNGRCSLFSYRLSIVDLNFGGQPFTSRDEDVVAIYNGEIYNHEELREQLHHHGYKVSSRSDGAIIPGLFQMFGPDFVKKINGMFSIAIWVQSSKKLFLYRDYFGIKPLYFSALKPGIAFSSEILPLMEFNGNGKNLDKGQVFNFFELGRTQLPHTFYEGIKQIPPGSYVVYEQEIDHIKLVQYWKPKLGESFQHEDRSDSRKLFSLIEESVFQSLMGDVDIGVLLSGGLDSSIIAMLAAKKSKYRLRTFTLVYESDSIGKSSDRDLAQLIASKIDSEHLEILVSHRDFQEDFHKIIGLLGEPFAGVTSMYFAAKAISQFNKVVLTGDGSDELFGSYFFHRLGSALDYQTKYDDLKKFDLLIDRDLYTDLLKARDEIQRRELVDRCLDYSIIDSIKLQNLNFAREKIDYDFASYLNPIHTMEFASESSALKQSLAIDFFDRLPNEILYYSDRLSMAWSVEVRPPFLQRQIVDFAIGLSHSTLMRQGDIKSLLKESFANILPREVLNRKKEGFVLPLHEWFQGPLNSWMNEILADSEIKKHGIFEIERVRSLKEKVNTGDYRVSKILHRLISFQIWWSQQFE